MSRIGNYLYVTGHKGTSANQYYNPLTYDLFVRKYNPDDCTLVWEIIWDNGEKDAGFVLATDGSYLYVGGITKEGTITKALLQKRNLSDGTIVGTYTWGNDADHYYEVNGLAIYGNYIYVTHWDQVSSPSYSIDAIVRKLDLDGNEQSGGFSYTITDSSADGHIYADSTGVYVAGRTLNSSTWDAYVAKIDPDGTQLWFETWGDIYYNQALSLASDGSHLYLSGQTNTGGSNPNAILLKYEMDDGYLADETVQDDYIDFSRGIFVDTDYIYMSIYSKQIGYPGYTTLQTYNKSNTEAPVDERIWTTDAGDENLATSLYADNVYIYMVGKTSSGGAGGYDARLIKVERPTP